jgi:cell division protein FtsW
MERMDRVIFYIVVVLLILGILFVYSSSYYISIKYTGSPYHFLVRQAIWAVVSFGFFLFFIRFDYRRLKKFIKPMVFITLLLLVLVFVPGIGAQRGGARRWLDFRFFAFNPSELAKLTVIIYLSYILTKKQGKLGDFTFGLLPPLLLVSTIFFIILMQSGFSIAVLLLFVAFILFFLGGASMRHILSIGIISLPVVIAFISKVSYRKARILSFLNPWEDMTGRGYHIVQSLKAFAEGGLIGVGLGNSIQKMGRLPTPHNDFIFSVISEEIGLVGAALIAGIYLVFFIRGVVIARKCGDRFGQMLAFGITALFTSHALFNMGIATGIIPPTGVSLPFISYGGSSMLIMAIACGILENISAQSAESRVNVRPMEEIDEIIDESF